MANFEYPFPPCPRYVSTIRSTERIGNSLVKINNNFANLQTGYCKLIQRILDIVQVRTFFYYGPNANTNPTSGMQNNQASYPNNTTIQNFVNSPTQLNVPTISEPGDVVYVIYQKTGFYSRNAAKKYSGTLTVDTGSNIQAEKIKIINYTDLDANSSTPGLSGIAPDRYNVFSPVFVIWRLTATPTTNITPTSVLTRVPVTYNVDSGFPKFTQAETIANEHWDKPNVWQTYQL